MNAHGRIPHARTLWLLTACLVPMMLGASCLAAETPLVHKTFSVPELWYSTHWNARGTIELDTQEEHPIALLLPGSIRVGASTGATVVHAGIDTWFGEHTAGIACLFFYSLSAPHRLYFLATDTQGRWNFYHETYSTDVLCSALNLMIDDYQMYLWKRCAGLRPGAFAPNRLSVRFRSATGSSGIDRLTVTAFLNEREMITVVTPLPSSSPLRIGFGAHAISSDGATVFFDNLLIDTI